MAILWQYIKTQYIPQGPYQPGKSHKNYMGGLILGVNTVYMLFLLLLVGKGLRLCLQTLQHASGYCF